MNEPGSYEYEMLAMKREHEMAAMTGSIAVTLPSGGVYLILTPNGVDANLGIYETAESADRERGKHGRGHLVCWVPVLP